MPADPSPGAIASPPEPAAQAERRARTYWWLGLVLAAIVGMVLRRYALEIGMLSDDYMQRAMITGLYPGDGYAPFDLYAFFKDNETLALHVDRGTIPWFAEPGFHASVMRPLSSLLLWLDHTLAPDSVRLWHMHSLMWLGLTIVSFGLCVRALLPVWPAALAVALLVCEAGFVSPLGWLANRCVLVCAAFGFLAIYVHLEWRRPNSLTPTWLRRAGPGVELLLLGLCLAGGEYGLGAIAYLFAWELFAGPSRLVWRSPLAWSGLAKALAPATITVVGFLLAHKLLGYGTFGADVYVDPLHDPAGWLEWLKFRLPKLTAGALWGIPAETLGVFQHAGASWWLERWPAANAYEAHYSHMYLGTLATGIAGLGFALARAGLRPEERQTLRALLIGGLVGLLPVTVAPAHSRLLILAQLGACGSVALLALATARLISARAPTSAARPRLSRSLGVLLLPLATALIVLNTWFDLRWSHKYFVHLHGLDQADLLAFTKGDLLDQELEGRDVVVLNGPSQAVGMYGGFVLDVLGYPVPASWRGLALGSEHATYVHRPRADTLDLTAIQGAWLRTAGELFFRRATQPLPAGSVVHYPSLRVEVLADEGGWPTKVRFVFPHDLDDPRYLFLISTQRGLERWPLPPVGKAGIVPLPRMPFPDHLIERDADVPAIPRAR